MAFQKGHKKLGGRVKGTPNKASADMKEFYRLFLSDPEYRASAKRRIIDGDAPHLERLMHYYVLGKPQERIAIEELPPLLVIDDTDGSS